MLSDMIKINTKRATVLAGSVAAAALLIGVDAQINTANALLIDNFGGVFGDGARAAAGPPATGVGEQVLYDTAGGGSTSNSTSSCIGGGIGGTFSWCLGGSRLLTVNAQSSGDHEVEINDNIPGGRASGFLAHSPQASGLPGVSADAGITALRYPTSGTFGATAGGRKNLLIKEEIEDGVSGDVGVCPSGMTCGTTETDLDVDTGFGLVLDFASIDFTTSFRFRITSNNAVDLTGDGDTTDAGEGVLLDKEFVVNPALGPCTPDCMPVPATFVFPFLDFLTVVNATSIASLEAFLREVAIIQVNWDNPAGPSQNDMIIDTFRTGSELPEPGTLAIVGAGLIGLTIARRRRKQAA